MKRVLIILTILATFTPRAHAQNAARAAITAPFAGGESLSYNVAYRAKLIPPINLLRVTLRTLDENFGGRPHFHVIGNGRTLNGVDGIFSLNDTYHSWLDAATLRPSRLSTDIHENDYKYRATYNYNWDSMVTTNVFRRDTWDADRRETVPLQENSGDALSLLYRLRGIDLSQLVPGEAYPLELVLDKTSRTIEYRFLGYEEIKIKKWGKFRAIKITCTMATSDGSTYEEGMMLTAWVSDDENRVPLLIECPIRVGRVTVTLAEGSKLVRPMTSRIK